MWVPRLKNYHRRVAPHNKWNDSYRQDSIVRSTARGFKFLSDTSESVRHNGAVP